MKNFKKISALLLVLLFVFSMVCCGNKLDELTNITKEVNTVSGEYAGKTVILHTNDVHGAVEGYSYLPTLKAEIEAAGGTVILVDAGDWTSGTIYTAHSKGESAVTLMNQVGYDIVSCGNHEFEYGYENLIRTSSKGKFKMLCSNVYKDGKTIFDSEIVVNIGDIKIGFFALLTPETKTKINPVMIQGLSFTEDKELIETAEKEVASLKGCDVVICLAHLGVDEESIGHQSYDVARNVEGIDFIIDAHSHTVMEQGENGEAIQQTGTKFANIGMIVINNETKKIESHKLVSTENLEQDADVLTSVQNIISAVDTQYGITFAISSVFLDGVKENVRSKETNLGDLVADSMVWFVLNETKLDVDEKYVVGITNGGAIRANIEIGDVSRKDTNSVLPFGNTLFITYVTGKELLEVLEASTYCAPSAAGGFPQISGLKITVDTTVEYDAGEQYPDSTYARPNSIKRVTINEVNGEPFNENATYAIVTNNFCAAGGDTYYAFKRAYDAGNGFDTSVTVDECLSDFIKYALNCEIGAEYAEPQGRITIVE